MEEKEERVLEVKEPGEDFLNHVIVQLGVLKDKAQSTNKYKSEAEFVPNKILIKPSIIFDAQTVVDTVKHFRKTFNINKKAFKGRVAATNAWGTAVFHPLLKDYYRAAYAKSKQRKWVFGSHYMRKLYAVASYNIYQTQITQMTGKFVDQSYWISTVLAHAGSIATSLSYSNVVVSFGFKVELFKTPPDHLISLFAGQLKHLQATVDALKRKVEKEVPAVERVMSESASPEVGFLTSDGTVVILPKHTKRRFEDDDDRIRTVQTFVELLEQRGLPASARNLGKLGFGRPTVLLWQRYNKSIEDETSSSENEEDDDCHNPEPATNKVRPQHPLLKRFQRVIAPRPPTQRARAEALQRDRRRFGSKNVLEDESDCHGLIQRNVKLAKKLHRDLCEDEVIVD